MRFLMFSKKCFLVLTVSFFMLHTAYSQNVTEYSPEANIYFINEMQEMLEKHPQYFPFNFSTFLEAGGNTSNRKTGDIVTEESRAAFSGNTILPLPFLKNFSISAGVTLVGDSLSDDLDFMNMNIFSNAGIIFDNSLLTLGFFVGNKCVLTYTNWYEEDGSGVFVDSIEVSNATDEFKFLFIPIIKTDQIKWLSFLKNISNYINFGDDEVDFGQTYNFNELTFGGLSFEPSFYYKNELYSSFARNWIFGGSFIFKSANNQNGFYAILNSGYRYFYDYPIMKETEYLKDSIFIKAIGGYITKKNNNIWCSFSYNFRGFGFGLGYQGRVIGFNFDSYPRLDELDKLSFTLSMRLRFLPKQKEDSME